MTSTPKRPDPSPLIALARADLAGRLGIPEEEIAVASTELTAWRDASLGCAPPGKSSAARLTLGFRLLLEAQEQVYEYHTDLDETVRLCLEQHKGEQPPALGEGTPRAAPPTLPAAGSSDMVEYARQDLARRLGIAVSDIEVLATEEVTWPDTSMGCPQPGMAYLQVLQDGLRIRLRGNQEVYAYHSGGNRAPFLCQQKASSDRKP